MFIFRQQFDAFLIMLVEIDTTSVKVRIFRSTDFVAFVRIGVKKSYAK
jgi:hypothetical protein